MNKLSLPNFRILISLLIFSVDCDEMTLYDQTHQELLMRSRTSMCLSGIVDINQ